MKRGIQYRVVATGRQQEFLIIEIWGGTGSIRVVNFYNPANKLLAMEELDAYLRGRVIWCGDFKAHSTLWGESNDRNRAVIEELMEVKNYV